MKKNTILFCFFITFLLHTLYPMTSANALPKDCLVKEGRNRLLTESGSRTLALQNQMKMLKTCKAARFARQAGKWAMELRKFDLAVQMFSLALRRNPGLGERIPIKTALKRARRIFRKMAQKRLIGQKRLKRIPCKGCKGGTRGIFAFVRRPLNVRISFAYNSAELEAPARVLLEDLVSILKQVLKRPNTKVQVIGHTDTKGGLKFNRKLSLRRARSVIVGLVRRGISKSRLLSAGLAYCRPRNVNLGRKACGLSINPKANSERSLDTAKVLQACDSKDCHQHFKGANESEIERGQNRRVEFRVVKD